jgi:hypothetical protein
MVQNVQRRGFVEPFYMTADKLITRARSTLNVFGGQNRIVE